SRSRRHSARVSVPPARWIAPSTPPPPRSAEFAALTTASVRPFVRSPGRPKISMVCSFAATLRHADRHRRPPAPPVSDRLDALQPTDPCTRAAAAAGLLKDGQVHPSVFARMSALALTHGALNLGQGFPDDPPPAAVSEAAV